MFPETQWTVVLAAGGTPSPESAAALERLCSSYWYPLYAYVRRRGHSPPDAQDLTQEFFARLLEHNWIAPADRHKGRFRSFLLMAMKRFLAKEWDKVKTAQTRRAGAARSAPVGHGRNPLHPGTGGHLHAGAGVRKAVGADTAGIGAQPTARTMRVTARRRCSTRSNPASSAAARRSPTPLWRPKWG